MSETPPLEDGDKVRVMYEGFVRKRTFGDGTFDIVSRPGGGPDSLLGVMGGDRPKPLKVEVIGKSDPDWQTKLLTGKYGSAEAQETLETFGRDFSDTEKDQLLQEIQKGQEKPEVLNFQSAQQRGIPDGTKVRVTFEGYVDNQSAFGGRVLVHQNSDHVGMPGWRDQEILALFTPERWDWATVEKLEDPPSPLWSDEPKVGSAVKSIFVPTVYYVCFEPNVWKGTNNTTLDWKRVQDRLRRETLTMHYSVADNPYEHPTYRAGYDEGLPF